MIKLTLTAISVCTVSMAFAGDLKAIADVGATTQLQVSTKQNQLAKQLENPQFRAEFIESQLQQFEANRYQIKTPELTIGEISTYKVAHKYLPKPFALVGCDRTSMQWLEQNAQELIKNKPDIYVINCDGKADFNTLKELVPLKFLAINGSQFAKVYNLKHYPVLVTKELIAQ
jgi:integrating conjugative element protein (TIGR03765 family)